MPALPPLIPNATHTNGGGIYDAWGVFGCTDPYQCVDDDPASFTVDSLFNATANTMNSIFFGLTDTPADFVSMVSIDIDCVIDDQFITGQRFFWQVFASNELQPLTSEQANIVTAPTQRFTTSFTYVNPGNKTLWDGARLRCRCCQPSCGSGKQNRIFACRLINGVYNN